MAFDFNTGPIGSPQGQPDTDSDTGTTDKALAGDTGQAQDNIGTADSGQTDVTTKAPEQSAPTTPAEDTFFDPNAVPEELKPAYKQMQSAFTKKLQGVKDQRQKIEAYDAFNRDPLNTLRQIANQYGMTIQDGRTAQPQGQAPNQGNPLESPDYQPQTWGQLAQDMTGIISRQIMQQLNPVIAPLYQNVEQITSNHIENQLDAIDGNWRIYEDEIKQNMREHPTLIKSPGGINKLYRISIPDDVQTSRTVQDVVKKFGDKAQAAKVGSKSQAHTSNTPSKKINSFADAVALAKQQLNSTGR